MILDITKLGEDILRQTAEPVKEVNDEIRQLVNDMFDTMIEAQGVGLAGPQVGTAYSFPNSSCASKSSLGASGL